MTAKRLYTSSFFEKKHLWYTFFISIFLFSKTYSQSVLDLNAISISSTEDSREKPSFPKGNDIFLNLLKEKVLIPENLKNENETFVFSFKVGKDGSLSKFLNLGKTNEKIFEDVKRITISLGPWNPTLDNNNKPIESTATIMIPLFDEIFTAVEQQPEFIGGQSAMYKYITDNMKYPELAKNSKIQGRVFVKFVVEKDGSIGYVDILKGIGFGCDEEAKRLIKSMPKWNPGKMYGKVQRVFYNIPVVFKLN